MENEKYAEVYGIYDKVGKGWALDKCGRMYQSASPGALMPYFALPKFHGSRYVIETVAFDGEPSEERLRSDSDLVVTGWFASEHSDGEHKTWTKVPLSQTLALMAQLIRSGIPCSFTPVSEEEASQDGNS